MRLGRPESKGFRRRWNRLRRRNHYWRAALAWAVKQSPTPTPFFASIKTGSHFDIVVCDEITTHYGSIDPAVEDYSGFYVDNISEYGDTK